MRFCTLWWQKSFGQQVLILWIYAKNRVKNELFWRLWQIHGAFLLCGWWMGDKYVKTHPNDVFPCGPTLVFISSAVMEKSIFENFEKSSFWVIFTVFLLCFKEGMVKKVEKGVPKYGRILAYKILIILRIKCRYEDSLNSVALIRICWPCVD